MSLETYLARRLGRAATPETPLRNPGFQLEPAQTLACTPATPETPKTVTTAANEADDLAALLAAHGDGSAQGVDWAAWRLTTATSSATWAVVNPRGLTLLFTVQPIPKPRSYLDAWPVERIAPWPDVEDDADDDLLAVPQAQEAAQQAVQRAAAPCWQCRHLNTTTSATNRLPTCGAGHRLTWRTTTTRTWPGRLDARDCGDRA